MVQNQVLKIHLYINLLHRYMILIKNYEQYSAFIYGTTILLWLISSYNLNNNFNSGKIKSVDDLFNI